MPMKVDLTIIAPLILANPEQAKVESQVLY
jgi:hypothetical protein